MQPLWRSGNGGSWLIGAAWVFGSAPMIFNSFQSVLHTIEERSQSTSKEVVVRICVATVGVATLFYLLIIAAAVHATPWKSEEHTSELQSLMRISYAVFCLKKKKYK